MKRQLASSPWQKGVGENGGLPSDFRSSNCFVSNTSAARKSVAVPFLRVVALALRAARAYLVAVLLACVAAHGQAEVVDTIRGNLVAEPGQPPAEGKPLVLISSLPKEDDGRKITLVGDEFSEGQLRDPRLAGREWEFEGRVTADGSFTIYKLFTMKEGKRHRVTYYCEVCHIYTHEPGPCMCCQDVTELREIPEE